MDVILILTTEHLLCNFRLLNHDFLCLFFVNFIARLEGGGEEGSFFPLCGGISLCYSEGATQYHKEKQALFLSIF